ncbi:MAG: sigma-70 family RNA polymerase sigma factor [Candidatus Zixiibacteriota bacterium]|nr:MAG: sigma-70 family RNA polymerase sigma factor [candidate division Zixibacteria bacterium]
MKDERDSSLIQEFKQGDEKAFNQLVLRYQKRVYDLTYRLVRNHEDAADLSQEVFVRAYSNLRKFEERSSFYVWLTRIAVNLCINFSKRERFRSFLSIFDISQKPEVSVSPEEDVEKEELRRALDRAVKSLPERQRATFVLKRYQELPYREIAQIMEISEGAAKANYFQAVKKLQKLLGQYR